MPSRNATCICAIQTERGPPENSAHSTGLANFDEVT